MDLLAWLSVVAGTAIRQEISTLGDASQQDCRAAREPQGMDGLCAMLCIEVLLAGSQTSVSGGVHARLQSWSWTSRHGRAFRNFHSSLNEFD